MQNLNATQVQARVLANYACLTEQPSNSCMCNTCKPRHARHIQVFTPGLKQQALDVAVLLSDLRYVYTHKCSRLLECPFVTNTCIPAYTCTAYQLIDDNVVKPTKEKSTAGNCCL